jgi:hypothetical protein
VFPPYRGDVSSKTTHTIPRRPHIYRPSEDSLEQADDKDREVTPPSPETPLEYQRDHSRREREDDEADDVMSIVDGMSTLGHGGGEVAGQAKCETDQAETHESSVRYADLWW